MESTEHYDVILLGTGFTECLLGNLLVKEGKKVLQLNRERFSGGANGSISSFEELQEKFPISLPNAAGEWNVDLIPKLFVGKDKMMKLLEHLGVKLHCKPIQNIYVASGSKLIKVPSSEQQVEVNSCIPKEEKESCKKLIEFAKCPRKNKPRCTTLNDLVKQCNLGQNCKALLLQGIVMNETNEDPNRFLDHLRRFSDVKHYQSSAVSYPLYGNGDMLQGLHKTFSQKGGRCMLNRPINTVKISGGKAFVVARGLTAMAGKVVGDPSYFQEALKSTKKVIRGLFILDHSIAGTDNSKSSFITIPGSDHGRKNDIFICQTGSDHNVTPHGYFIVHVSTISETSEAEEELKPVLDILHKVCAQTISIDEIFVPDQEKYESKVLISSSYDVAMNWESVYDDVARLYKNVTGRRLSISQ